jgi:UDP-glucose 4-epimerase
MFSSTSAAYGRNSSPNVETQSPDPLNPYSVTKLNGENLCKMYTELFGLPTVIFRYFNVYGPRQPVRGQYAPVLGIFKRQKDANEPLTIVGDGNQRRDFVHVEDVARANIIAALTDPGQDAYGQVYNIGTGKNFSVNEIAEMFLHEKIYIAPRPGEARVSLANNEKMRNTFGWTPTHDLDTWVSQQL